jgi:hypothetical protein
MAEPIVNEPVTGMDLKKREYSYSTNNTASMDSGPDQYRYDSQKKYGENSNVKGIDYLQKIVQLPFQIPTWKEGWKEEDIEKSIEKIITTELKDYELVDEFKKNMKLLVKGVQLNTIF